MDRTESEEDSDKPEVVAHPLLGFQLLHNPDQPSVAMIAFETAAGPTLFTVTKDILDELATTFQQLADTMPRENGG